MSRRTVRRPWTRVAALVIPAVFAVVVALDLVLEATVLTLLGMLLAPLVLGIACVGVEALVLSITHRADRLPRPSRSG